MVFRVLLALFFGLGTVGALAYAITVALKSQYSEDDVQEARRNFEDAQKYKTSDVGRYEQRLHEAEEASSKSLKKFSIGITLAIICIVAFILVPWNFYTINAGELAVIKHLGVATEVRTSGTYANFWMTNKAEKYDIKVRNIDITTATYSNDAQTMDIQMTIQYSINSEHLIEIVNKYGDIAMLESKIQSVAIEQTKAILSSYKAMDIIARRSEMSPLVSTAIKNTITSDYYVTISTVVLTNIDFTDAFEKAVEEKMIAEQKKLQADYENQTAVAKAEAEAQAKQKAAEVEIEVAKAKAEAKLIEAEADKKAQAEVAKAEAITMKYNAIEIARALGLEVTEKDEDADGLIDSYVIDYTDDTEGKKAQLVSDYLKYVIYLETWDGSLPETYVTDANATVMVTP